MPTAISTVLAEGAVYFGDNGRALCAHPRCAGMTASATGRDLSGQRLYRASGIDVREWAAADLGDLTCECRRVTLTPIDGPDGYPLPALPKPEVNA